MPRCSGGIRPFSGAGIAAAPNRLDLGDSLRHGKVKTIDLPVAASPFLILYLYFYFFIFDLLFLFIAI